MKKLILLLVVMISITITACGSNDDTTITAADVVNTLKNASLPIGEVESYTEATDPNELMGKPNQYTSKSNFSDTRLEQGESMVGGSVEVFANQKDAESRKSYMETIYEAMPFMAEFLYLNDNILLRLSFSLTADQADEYYKALQEIK